MEIRSGTAPSGELEIYYEDMGDPGDPAVLLIMGLGAVSYTHLTLPTMSLVCISRWSPYH